MNQTRFQKVGTSVSSTVENKRRAVIKTKMRHNCWLEDIQKEVDAYALGKYFERLRENGTASVAVAQYCKYKMKLHFATEPMELIIELRLWANKVAVSLLDLLDVEETTDPIKLASFNQRTALLKEMREKCDRGVERYLNHKLYLSIIDPICGTKTLPIRVQPVWVATQREAHYTFRVYTTEKRAEVNGDFLTVCITDPELTHAHEVAHCIGVPDEYSYLDSQREYVRYYNPDATLGEVVVAEPIGVEVEDKDSTIMNGGDQLRKIHGSPIAMEAQIELSERLGRKVRCDIILA